VLEGPNFYGAVPASASKPTITTLDVLPLLAIAPPTGFRKMNVHVLSTDYRREAMMRRLSKLFSRMVKQA
jgi:hypothetical protein